MRLVEVVAAARSDVEFVRSGCVKMIMLVQNIKDEK